MSLKPSQKTAGTTGNTAVDLLLRAKKAAQGGTTAIKPATAPTTGAGGLPPLVAPPAPETFTPPPPTPALPALPTAGPPTATPAPTGAPSMPDIPPWVSLLTSLPQFGGAGGNNLASLFSGGMPPGLSGLPSQAQGPGFNPLEQQGKPVAGVGGMGNPGLGASATTGRASAPSNPALQGGGLSDLLQMIFGTGSRFGNTFGGASQFPFAPFLRGGGGFGSAGFNPMMRSDMQPGGGMGMGGGLGMTGQDPRANDMRRLLLQQMMQGGGMLGGGGGGLDVN